MTDYKNILIVKPSAIGDIIHTLPVINIIKKSWPNAKISWFVREEFAPLLQGNTDIDNVIIFKRKILGKFYYNRKSFGEMINLITILRKSKFDAVFDFQGLLRTAFFSFITGAKKRFGMLNAREGAKMFYTDKVANKGSINVSDYYGEILKYAGATSCEIKFTLPINEKSQKEVDILLKAACLEKNKFVLLIPGAAHLNKCWPVEQYAKLADVIHTKTGMQIVAAGSLNEKTTIENIQKLANAKIKDFAGKTTLQQLICLINSAFIVVSNDTGPGHIAAALNKKLVMIFGITNPRRVCPYNRPNCIAAIDAFDRDDNIESHNPKHSIENVSVEMVLDKINSQFNIC